MSAKRDSEDLTVIGWREWIALPALDIEAVKAKIDTGARSSALHAFDIQTFRRHGSPMVRFKVHPLQRDTRRTVEAEAVLVDERSVRSSSGAAQMRPVIETQVRLLGRIWTIELTLTNRDAMGFRMLLGRQAVRGRFLVDPSTSYKGGRRKTRKAAARKKKKKKKKRRKSGNGTSGPSRSSRSSKATKKPRRKPSS